MTMFFLQINLKGKFFIGLGEIPLLINGGGDSFEGDPLTLVDPPSAPSFRIEDIPPHPSPSGISVVYLLYLFDTYAVIL